jgi:hypothetical protein
LSRKQAHSGFPFVAASLDRFGLDPVETRGTQSLRAGENLHTYNGRMCGFAGMIRPGR